MHPLVQEGAEAFNLTALSGHSLNLPFKSRDNLVS
jgi:hypothetical protein